MARVNKITPKITPQSVIPRAWWGVYASSTRELLAFGRGFIESLIAYWINVVEECNANIVYYEGCITLFKGQTAVTLRQKVDTALDHPKQKSMMMEMCVGCDYMSGLAPEEYDSSPISCELIPDYLRERVHDEDDDEIRGAPEQSCVCMVTDGTDALINTSVLHLKMLLGSTRASRAESKARVRYLRDLLGQAQQRPCPATYRPLGYFQPGDSVVCYVDFSDARMKGFVLATVDEAPPDYSRFSVIADEPVHSNLDYHNGCGITYHCQAPTVVHLWEMKALSSHRCFERWWRATSPNVNPLALNMSTTREHLWNAFMGRIRRN